MPVSWNFSTWPWSRATRETSACCSGSTSVMPTPPLPGAAGAADAVRVDVGLLGRVEVDHVRDVVDVEAARGDVGCDERPHLAGVEPRERLLALRLALVAVDRDRVDVVAAQLLDEAVGAGLRAHEDEREPALVVVQQLDQRRHLGLVA